jgi:phage antirepressor YoqD-like protein
MQSPIQLFSNPQFGEIRITKTEIGDPLFCLMDLCNVIGISNSRNVRNRIDNEDVHLVDTPTSSGIQAMTYVTESGMYDVVLRSDSIKAKPFQKWVTTEVLPAIRKTGGYIHTSIEDTPESIMAKALLIADSTIKKQAKQLQDQAPKVLFADAVATSERSILIGELAKIMHQNGVSIGQNRLFEELRRTGYLGNKGEYYNTPTQRAIEQGLFEIKKTSITKPDGTVLVTTTTKVTGKGQIYFLNKFIKSIK